MICRMCGGTDWFKRHQYTELDRYEKIVGVTEKGRHWSQCCRCGFYQQWHPYDPDILQDIYSDAYWSRSLRGKSPSEYAHEIMKLPIHLQDNWYRGLYLERHAVFNTVLDMGAGLGLLSRELRRTGKKVDAVEQNRPARK